MTLSESFSIEDYVSPWTPSAVANKAYLAEGWDIAGQFIGLHLDALEAVAQASSKKATHQEQAVMVVGGHGFNIFVGALKLVVRGEFDVALYLMRPMVDIQAQLYAVSRDAVNATKYLEGELKASTARKLVVDELNAAGDADAANWIDARWSGEADAANQLAHSSVIHGDKLLESSNVSITPVLVGRADADEAPRMALMCLDYEDWLLTWFRAFHTSALEADWNGRFEVAREKFGVWAKSVAGAAHAPAPAGLTNAN